MAEKEDYIVISKKDFDYKKEHYVTHLATQMTRQEAIERMAKAICAKKNCKDVCNNCEVWLHFKDCAEAALNALLRE